MTTSGTRLLHGWGRTAASAATVVRPTEAREVVELVTEIAGGAVRGSGDRLGSVGAVIARGLGRSYGDAAQRSGGLVIDTSALDGIGPVEPATGLVEVGGGVSLDALVRRALPEGWFVPVTPGTRHVSIGGAVAADVHGKNHHVEGTFCAHVARLTLATPTGLHTVGPDGPPEEAELFWATAGGMGLTGVVVTATLRMLPVSSSWVLVDTERFDDLDELMATMSSSDDHYRYSVAWVDCTARRGPLGRSVLTRGDHAPRSALRSGRPARRAVSLAGPSKLRIPLPAPGGLVNRHTVRAFNEAWFRRAPQREVAALQPLDSFFYPLDGVGDWNLLYGKAGFVQYQFVVPDERAELVREAIRMTTDAGTPSSLAVLKRFGPQDPGPLSFPTAGWTLALDFPVGPPPLPAVLDRLDERVAEAGGRVYLAKDARLRPELVPVMYPAVGELLAVRRRVDPTLALGSDLSRRLGLDEAAPAATGRGREGREHA
ncbi:MAG: FAD-binding oxidoreductase [Acidimicrobiales bacterium]